VTEDGAVRFVETKAPSPIPYGEGTPLAGAGAAGGTGAKQSPQ